MKWYGLCVVVMFVLLVFVFGVCKLVGFDYMLLQYVYVNVLFVNYVFDDVNGVLVLCDVVFGNWWQLYDDLVFDGFVCDVLKLNIDLCVVVVNFVCLCVVLVVVNEQGGFLGGVEVVVQCVQELVE